MGADLPSAPSRSEDEQTRRRLLTLMGVGGAAALASVLTTKEAQAGHDGTNVLHLGEGNTTPPGSSTGVGANVNGFAFGVDNFHTGDAGGIHGRSVGSLPGVQGVGHTPSFAGVFGVSSLEPAPHPIGFGKGSGDGVRGMSGSGNGVRGESETGAGVSGHSDSGVAGNFFTNSGKALQVTGVVDITADFAGREVVIIESNHAGEGALSANARVGGIGVEGAAFPTEQELEFEDQKAGYGVRGIAMSAEGGYGEGPGVGVHGQSGSGTGVLGISQSGTAVEARSGVEGDGTGIALLVRGKSMFSTAGSAVIPAGQSSVFVANGAVTSESHISVTLVGNPGVRALQWVERAPGTGFTVHLTTAGPKPATPLTYFVVEPE